MPCTLNADQKTGLLVGHSCKTTVPVIVMQSMEKTFPAPRQSMNSMDVMKSEPGSCTDTRLKSSDDGNQVVGIKVEGLTSIKMEEDSEPVTSTVIKTEPANCVDILRGECGSCTETCSTSFGNGNQFLFVNVEEVTDIKEEEDPEPATSPLIETESTNTVSEQLYAFRRMCAFSCDVCNKAFARRPDLMRHKRRHSGERPFSCDVCNKAFGRQDNLKTHKRIHSGERPFSCNVCQKAFVCQTDLMRHKRIHSGEQPFSCDVCNRAFSQQGSLITHQRIHSGERPFSCDVCHKAFGRQDHLKAHKRIHSGERPLSCDVVL